MKSLLLWIKVVGLMITLMKVDCLQKIQCPPSIPVTKQPLKPIDFEDESFLSILIDKSQSPVKWKIENYNSSSKPSAPRPASGYNYIRVDRGSTNSFGVAVLSFSDLLLTSFETLTISFSFWISSKWSNFNNLQLFVVENGQETLLKDLSEYSNNEINQEWNFVDGISHQPMSTNVSFVFYAFCGSNEEDGIAIDNILVTHLATKSNTKKARIDTSESTTTYEPTTPETTTHETTTVETTTHETTTPETTSTTNSTNTTEPTSTTKSTTTTESTTPKPTSTTKSTTIEVETTYCY